jgi:hypothetical protein
MPRSQQLSRLAYDSGSPWVPGLFDDRLPVMEYRSEINSLLARSRATCADLSRCDKGELIGLPLLKCLHGTRAVNSLALKGFLHTSQNSRSLAQRERAIESESERQRETERDRERQRETESFRACQVIDC